MGGGAPSNSAYHGSHSRTVTGSSSTMLYAPDFPHTVANAVADAASSTCRNENRPPASPTRGIPCCRYVFGKASIASVGCLGAVKQSVAQNDPVDPCGAKDRALQRGDRVTDARRRAALIKRIVLAGQRCLLRQERGWVALRERNQRFRILQIVDGARFDRVAAVNSVERQVEWLVCKGKAPIHRAGRPWTVSSRSPLM